MRDILPPLLLGAPARFFWPTRSRRARHPLSRRRFDQMIFQKVDEHFRARGGFRFLARLEYAAFNDEDG